LMACGTQLAFSPSERDHHMPLRYFTSENDVSSYSKVVILNWWFTLFCFITGCHLDPMGFFCFRRFILTSSPSANWPSSVYKCGYKALCNRWLRSGSRVDSRCSRLAGNMDVGGAASTATVSVLANRLHRAALKATRWAVARVQGMTADIGGRSWSCRRNEFSFRKFEVAYVSIRPFRIARSTGPSTTHTSLKIWGGSLSNCTHPCSICNLTI
jgi:hypothetical protein